MRTLITVLLVSSLSLVTTGCYNLHQANNNTVSDESSFIEKAKYRYSQCLQIPNTGVQESAMMHIVKMKLNYPNEDYSEIASAVNDLVLKGSDERIRSTAFLTSICLHNPNCLTGVEFYNAIDDSERFYNLVSEEVNSYIASIRR